MNFHFINVILAFLILVNIEMILEDVQVLLCRHAEEFCTDKLPCSKIWVYLNLRKSNAPTLISKRKKNRANIYDVIINIKMIMISLKDLIHSMIEKYIKLLRNPHLVWKPGIGYETGLSAKAAGYLFETCSKPVQNPE